MQKTILSLLLSFLLLCCKQRPNVAIERQPTDTALQTNSNAQILNNIVVHEKGGLQISRAYLAYQDGTYLPPGNNVRTGEVVSLHLVVKQGWMAENGTVSIGATQTIVTAAGEPVLSSPDLFAAVRRINQAEAAQLQLKATISKTREDTDSFVVRYRIWDKLGSGEVQGSYRLHLAANRAK